MRLSNSRKRGLMRNCRNCGGPGHNAATCGKAPHYACPKCGKQFDRWPAQSWASRAYCNGDGTHESTAVTVFEAPKTAQPSSAGINLDLDKLVEKVSSAVVAASGLSNVQYDRIFDRVKEEVANHLEDYSAMHTDLTGELQQFTSTLQELRSQVAATVKHVHTLEINDVKYNFADNDAPSPILEDLVLFYKAKQLAMIWGPSGCGKSYAVEQAYRVIKETNKFTDEEFCFVPLSMTLGINEADLYGRMLPDGSFVESKVCHAFEHGGLILWDEMDAADQNLLMVLNRIVEYDDFYNPKNGKTYQKHPNFHSFAATNTNGRGATAAYNSRNRMDMATLTRFNQAIYLDYSVEVEEKVCPDSTMCRACWAIREFLQKNNAMEVMGTRHMRDVYKLYTHGIMPKKTLERAISTWAPNLQDGIKRLPEWADLDTFNANVRFDLEV